MVGRVLARLDLALKLHEEFDVAFEPATQIRGFLLRSLRLLALIHADWLHSKNVIFCALGRRLLGLGLSKDCLSLHWVAAGPRRQALFNVGLRRTLNHTLSLE